MNWQPITDEIPLNAPVLLRFEYKEGVSEVMLCKRIDRFTIEVGSYWKDKCDYCESNETYYCPAGFYEKMLHGFGYVWNYMGKELKHCTHFMVIKGPE